MVGIEARRGIALLAAPFLIAAAWFVSQDSLPTGFHVWLDTSSAIRGTVLYVAPLVGGLSAWAAGRDGRRGVGEMLAVTPRPPFHREFANWAGTALVCVAAYWVFAAVMLGLTLPNATWGAPLPGYLIVGTLAVFMASAVGYAVGYCVPSRFTAPLAAMGLFAASVLPSNLGPSYVEIFDLLSPAPIALVSRTVFMEVPQVAAQQSLWFLGLGALALAAVALKAWPRSPVAWSALLVAAGTTAAGFGLLTTHEDLKALSPYSGKVGNFVPFEPVCESGGITVCVHPAYAGLLPEATERLNEAAEPVAGLPGVPTHALQGTADHPLPTGFEPEDTARFTLSDYDGGPLRVAASDLVGGLVADERTWLEELPKEGPLSEKTCVSAYGRTTYSPAQEAQGIVQSWLLMRIGQFDEIQYGGACRSSAERRERFAALAPAEREAWLKENLADLRAGKLTPEDLP
jgi:hypothetical protein